jgi:spore germination protein GerM
VPLSFVVGISAIAIAAGGGLAWWTLKPAQSPAPPVAPITSNTVQPLKPDAKAPVEQSVQVYWLKTEGDHLQLAPSAVPLTETEPSLVLKAAFDQVLQGSPDPALTTTIPTETKLQSLEVKPDGIHVNLSADFTMGGGSASMMGRLGQVIYTATTLDPNAQVWISVDGQPLELLGGEGLEIDQPMTRQAFDQNFPL